MSVYATNAFSTQPGRAQDLIDTLTRVLPDTLKHGGCELIQILHDQDDPMKVAYCNTAFTIEAEPND